MTTESLKRASPPNIIQRRVFAIANALAAAGVSPDTVRAVTAAADARAAAATVAAGKATPRAPPASAVAAVGVVANAVVGQRDGEHDSESEGKSDGEPDDKGVRGSGAASDDDAFRSAVRARSSRSSSSASGSGLGGPEPSSSSATGAVVTAGEAGADSESATEPAPASADYTWVGPLLRLPPHLLLNASRDLGLQSDGAKLERVLARSGVRGRWQVLQGLSHDSIASTFEANEARGLVMQFLLEVLGDDWCERY